MDTTLSRLHAGQLLDGRYRVGSWIARGGMATVYLGTDTKLDRTVALKVAHAELAGDPEFVRRFTGEARSVARLSSPNVVAVYDQGDRRRPAVPGHGVRSRPDAAGTAARARQARARARRSTSSAGCWPAWPPRTRPGSCTATSSRRTSCSATGNTIKVADFGLARAASRASHTQTGMIIGTAAYLAPEQVSRSVSDARTDVYAAGVMLFEMLTGVAAAHRRDPARRGPQARQRRGAGPVQRGPRPAAVAGRAGRPGHQPGSRPAARRREPVPAARSADVRRGHADRRGPADAPPGQLRRRSGPGSAADRPTMAPRRQLPAAPRGPAHPRLRPGAGRRVRPNAWPRRTARCRAPGSA